LQGFPQQLFSGGPIGEGELAEGRHLRGWSALRVVPN
jgi:hypothetical protein